MNKPPIFLQLECFKCEAAVVGIVLAFAVALSSSDTAEEELPVNSEVNQIRLQTLDYMLHCFL